MALNSTHATMTTKPPQHQLAQLSITPTAVGTRGIVELFFGKMAMKPMKHGKKSKAEPDDEMETIRNKFSIKNQA